MKKVYTLLTLILAFFSFTKVTYALTNISVNNNKLIPEFNTNTLVYNVYVSSKTEIITINVAKEDDEIVTGSGSISLKKGLNEIEIISYKGEEQVKYLLNIVRGEIKNNEDDALLKRLIIKDHEIEFDSNTFSYFIDALETEERLDINYTSSSPTSNVKLSGDINLTKPKNIIKIAVTSENKKVTNTYKITVYKEIETKKEKEKKESFFDGKEFSSYELKLIITGLIILGLIILGILFYFIFIKNRNKKYKVKIKKFSLKYNLKHNKKKL